MSAPAKFLFDLDFAAPDKSRERPTQAELSQKVAEAEARAYRAGFDAAQHEAKVESAETKPTGGLRSRRLFSGSCR